MAYDDYEPRRTSDMGEDVLDYLYFNSGLASTAIVAVKGVVGDYAVYIGAVPGGPSETETVNFIAEHGCKMRQSEGEALFPRLPRYFKWRC